MLPVDATYPVATSGIEHTQKGREMINNTTNGGLGVNNQFVQGSPVYDVDGNQVGTVSEHGVEANCLIVHHGLMRTDVYVPLGYLRGATDQGVYLTVNQDQFNNFSKNQPPGQNDNANADNTDKTNADQANNTYYATPGTGTYAGQGNTAAAATGTGYGTTGYAARGEGQMTNDNATTVNSNDQPRELGNYPGLNEQQLNRVGATPLENGDIGIPVAEEQLTGQKSRGEVGRVEVHKSVVQQPETVSAPVTHDELRVEHNPVEDNIPAGDEVFQNQDIEVPLMGEELNVQKQARIVDELHLHKDAVTENERIQDTVRRERVNIEGVDQPLDAQPLNDRDQNNANAPQQ